MKYNELQLEKAKAGKRVGRGIAAGQGKTAGRGTKGQKSRTGYSKKPGFAGGQNPLMQALPKLPGFKSHKPKAENVSLDQLEAVAGKTVTSTTLFELGLVTSPYALIKLLNKGDTSPKSLTVQLQSASKTAIAAIEKSGGTFAKTARLGRPAKPVSDKK
ncbi:50S ribosomal protein L15 [Candidatus Saccharibacteria bacterium]|nr:50S ribosomal protein L15 [Candidatus Saccharibacteria bacterium]